MPDIENEQQSLRAHPLERAKMEEDYRRGVQHGFTSQDTAGFVIESAGLLYGVFDDPTDAHEWGDEHLPLSFVVRKVFDRTLGVRRRIEQ